jgi:arsenate reductase
MLFICYPKCTTCKKAMAWLNNQGINVTQRNIKEERPTYDELKTWHDKSHLPLKRFFNTSGQLYKALQLKDKLPSMTEEEQLQLLASDGMLVKRPLLIGDEWILVGFRQQEWEQKLSEAKSGECL